jgi:endonuclease V-like protein UPF0215 family
VLGRRVSDAAARILHAMPPTHVVGFDDAPFVSAHRGDVVIVGAVYAGARMEGVVSGRVRRDGVNATRELLRLVRSCRWYPQLQGVLLQGITMAGFNVVDLPALHRGLQLPVLALCRRAPDLEAIRAALLSRVRGGARKWRLIAAAPPIEAIAGLYAQRLGLDVESAERLIQGLAIRGKMPEPLRCAHLIAAGLAGGGTRHRV